VLPLFPPSYSSAALASSRVVLLHLLPRAPNMTMTMTVAWHMLGGRSSGQCDFQPECESGCAGVEGGLG
jgi:hypothetical protein